MQVPLIRRKPETSRASNSFSSEALYFSVGQRVSHVPGNIWGQRIHRSHDVSINLHQFFLLFLLPRDVFGICPSQQPWLWANRAHSLNLPQKKTLKTLIQRNWDPPLSESKHASPPHPHHTPPIDGFKFSRFSKRLPGTTRLLPFLPSAFLLWLSAFESTGIRKWTER